MRGVPFVYKPAGRGAGRPPRKPLRPYQLRSGLPGRLSPRLARAPPAPRVPPAPICCIRPRPPQPSPRDSSPPPLVRIFPGCNLSFLFMDVGLFFFFSSLSPLNGREGTWHPGRGSIYRRFAQTQFSILPGPHFSFFAFPSGFPGRRWPGCQEHCS